MDEQAHYCSAGRDLIVAENSRLRATLAAKDAEIERLRAAAMKLLMIGDPTHPDWGKARDALGSAKQKKAAQ